MARSLTGNGSGWDISTLKNANQRPASRLAVTVLTLASAGSGLCHLTFNSPTPCK